ncbi:hypothetical protein GJAV_G00190910 [Gymnothorax javanicus]|nr:hypothetical protein GJAV_G00190910 [Gymnothorax javanicus]
MPSCLQFGRQQARSSAARHQSKTMQGILRRSVAVIYFLLLCRITMAKKDYYGIIHVPESASQQQIKKAFHRLAVKYHPDKNNSPDASTIFSEIVEAYEVLSNDAKRRRYDELGPEAFKVDYKDETTYGANIFRFSFEELIQGLGLEDDLYLSLPEDVWTFQMDDVDEGEPRRREGIFGSDFFNFFGGDFNKMSMDHQEDGFQDLEPSFCWIKTHSDGTTSRVCEDD